MPETGQLVETLSIDKILLWEVVETNRLGISGCSKGE